MSQPESNSPGPLAVISSVLGAIALVTVCMGCVVNVPYLAFPLTVMAVVMGVIELQRINQGEGSEAGTIWAQLGVASGGAGCILQLVWAVFMVVVFVLYFAFLAFMIFAGAAGAAMQ